MSAVLTGLTRATLSWDSKYNGFAFVFAVWFTVQRQYQPRVMNLSKTENYGGCQRINELAFVRDCMHQITLVI